MTTEASAAVVAELPEDYDDAFEAAAIEGAKGVVKDATEEVETETPVKKETPVTEVKTPVVENKDTPAAGVVETPVVAAPSPADIALEALTKAQTQLADRNEAARVKKETDDKVAADAKTAADALAARTAPHQPTEAESAAMAKFEKEFPSEFIAMQTRLKQQKQEMNAEIYRAVQEGIAALDKRIKPIEATVAAQAPVVQSTAIEQAVNAIVTAHKDYEEIHPLLQPWIAALPAYKRAAVQAVYDGGSAKDVIDMITDFKKDTGRVEAVPAAGAGAEVPKPAPKKGASKEEIDAGAPVVSRRAAPKAGAAGEPDKNDYDGAFDEAADK